MFCCLSRPGRACYLNAMENTTQQNHPENRVYFINNKTGQQGNPMTREG
jgi:hypothetical protein